MLEVLTGVHIYTIKLRIVYVKWEKHDPSIRYYKKKINYTELFGCLVLIQLVRK